MTFREYAKQNGHSDGWIENAVGGLFGADAEMGEPIEYDSCGYAVHRIGDYRLTQSGGHDVVELMDWETGEALEEWSLDDPDGFYLIEREYVGPNPEGHMRDHRLMICTKPARGNSSHEVIMDGWCGTTNDWSTRAHGRYASMEEARDALLEKFSEATEIEDEDRSAELDGHAVELYRPTKYDPWSRAETEDFLWSGMEQDVTASTTDDELENMATLAEEHARVEHGATLSDAEDILRAYRDRLIAEQEDED